jgi:hypothetical protein
VKLDKGHVEGNRVARSKRVIFWQMSWTRPRCRFADSREPMRF